MEDVILRFCNMGFPLVKTTRYVIKASFDETPTMIVVEYILYDKGFCLKSVDITYNLQQR